MPQVPKPPNSERNDPFRLARRLQTAVWIYDTDCQRVAYANEAACKIWGASSEQELKTRDLSVGMSSTVANRLKQYQTDFVERDAKFTETWTLHPNDAPVTLDVVYSGVRMPDGRMSMMCEVIGDSEKTTETLRSTKALLHTDFLIALIAEDGRCLYQNPAARSVLPTEHSRFDEIFFECEQLEKMRSDWSTHGDARSVSKIKTTNGAGWYDFSIKRCLDAATGEQALLVTGFDVSELKTTRDRARFLAARDQLTGCFNRSYLQVQLEEASTRDNCIGYALLYIDIDMFKNVNDTHGHEAGDSILCAVADRLSKQLEGNDILARMGGDEFVVLIARKLNHSALSAKMEALRAELKRPIRCGPLELNVTPSIGVEVLDEYSSKDWTLALQRADLALYEAKRKGRDRFIRYTAQIGAQAEERKWLATETERALREDELDVFYQPRIDLKTNRVVAAEALLRWFHPERGYISPCKYIPLCEEIGIIGEIGAFVLRKACEQLALWQEQGLSIDVSVNVSPKQFQREGFIAVTEKILQNAHVTPDKIELEITESSLIGDSEIVSERIKRLESLGVRIALDDFGTGYSNLAHISRFSVNCIKVDRSVVGELPGSGPLLSLILALAKQINASVVAEGVETDGQLTWLRHKGCDQVQGFYYSKAVPPEELAAVCSNVAKIANRVVS